MDDDAAMLRPFGEIAVAPDIVEPLEIGRPVFLAVGSFQNITGIDGKALVQTSSPFSWRTGLPSSSQTSMARPSPGPWISPRQTGCSGLPSTKQETMSVPPDIDASCTSSLMPS
jgi:hypothetical protein